MKIYHNTNHVFSFTDRVRILFGKKLTVYSEISTKEDVEILGEASCKTLVDKIFPRKLIGAGYTPERNLSEPGKDFLGEELTKQLLTPGTLVVLVGDGNKYSVVDKQWDGVFVPVTPIKKGNFNLADIERVRLIN